MVVREIEGISCGALLPTFIFNLYPSSVCRGMGAVNMGYGQVKTTLVPVENSGPDLLPFLLDRPCTMVLEDGVPTWALPTEETP